MTNYSEDFLRTDDIALSTNNFYTARLTSDSQKGNIWVRYNNVGTYNGQIIDLKIYLLHRLLIEKRLKSLPQMEKFILSFVKLVPILTRKRKNKNYFGLKLCLTRTSLMTKNK